MFPNMLCGLVALCLMTSMTLAQPSSERVVIVNRELQTSLPPDVTADLVYDSAGIDAAILSGLRTLQQKPASRKVFVAILGGDERPSSLLAGILAMVPRGIDRRDLRHYQIRGSRRANDRFRVSEREDSEFSSWSRDRALADYGAATSLRPLPTISSS